MKYANNVTELVGNTPLVKLQDASNVSGATVLGKCEFMNPSSSVKDRIGTNMIKVALKEGLINKSEEKFFEIFKNENIKIEKIVSNGQKSPDNFWYEQEKSEYILLLSGYAILEFEDFEIELFKGDCLNMEASKKHRVKFTSLDEPTIWFAVFY